MALVLRGVPSWMTVVAVRTHHDSSGNKHLPQSEVYIIARKRTPMRDVNGTVVHRIGTPDEARCMKFGTGISLTVLACWSRKMIGSDARGWRVNTTHFHLY